MKHDMLAPWAERVPDAPEILTAQDLMAMEDGEWLYELVKGRLVRMPGVGGGHGHINLQVASQLNTYVGQHGLGIVLVGEIGFLLSGPGEPDTVLAADVAFVRSEHVPARESPEWASYWRVAPDLVVEVVSPSQFRPEMAAKARPWLKAGARLVWLLWPAQQQIDIWHAGETQPGVTLRSTDTLDGADVLPGFTVPVASFFA